MSSTQAGYDRHIVFEFLTEHGELREDGQFGFINETRVPETEREKMRRWNKFENVPLDRVDSLLMRFGFMTYELEDWANEHYGWDAFVDPNAAPADLVA